MQQATLDPELDEQFTREARVAFIEKIIDGFLAQGYSLDHPDELIAAVVTCLKRGPCAKIKNAVNKPRQ